MHNKIFTLIALITVLGGCATRAGYERMCRSYLNQPAINLMYNFGTPIRTYTINGVTAMDFYSESTDFVPNYGTNTIAVQDSHYRNIGYLQQQNTGGHYETISCLTTFYINNGYVINYKFSGNGCNL